MNISKPFQKPQATAAQTQVRSRQILKVRAQQEKPAPKAEGAQAKPAEKPAPKAEGAQAKPDAKPAAKPAAKAKGPSGPPEPRKVNDRKGDTLFFATDQSLTYLDGSLPADYGFDPLGLLDPDGKADAGFISPDWLKYSEVIHCRYAMLGAAGCVAPELLGKLGFGPEIPWFKVGIIPPAGYYQPGYWANPYALAFIEVIFFHMAELRRWQDFKYPGSMGEESSLYPLKAGWLTSIFKGSGNPAYPGGPLFDIWGFSKDEKAFQTRKIKEIKNGRLAMVAMLGYGAQAVLTGQGPVQNFLDHINNPLGENILTNLSKAPM